MKGRKTTEVYVSSELSADGVTGQPVIVAGKVKKDADHEATAQKLR